MAALLLEVQRALVAELDRQERLHVVQLRRVAAALRVRAVLAHLRACVGCMALLQVLPGACSGEGGGGGQARGHGGLVRGCMAGQRRGAECMAGARPACTCLSG
jgi:hypothetical protein